MCEPTARALVTGEVPVEERRRDGSRQVVLAGEIERRRRQRRLAGRRARVARDTGTTSRPGAQGRRAGADRVATELVDVRGSSQPGGEPGEAEMRAAVEDDERSWTARASHDAERIFGERRETVGVALQHEERHADVPVERSA